MDYCTSYYKYSNTLTSTVNAKDSEFSIVADCWSLYCDSILPSSSFKNKTQCSKLVYRKK